MGKGILIHLQDVNESKKSSKLDIWLDEERENLLRDITSLVKIESVAQEEDPTSDEPFGSECKKALDQFLYISRRDKMESYNHDGYCASAIIILFDLNKLIINKN